MIVANSNILITGANRGIGLALAQALAKRGAHLKLVLRKEDPSLKQQLLSLGAKSVEFFVTDLSQRRQVDDLAKSLYQVKVDILINNAGLLTGGLLETQDLDEIYNMFQVNLLSTIHITRALLPSFLKQKKGLIVNNASVSAVMHFPGATTYAASKAALLAFNNSLELELKGSGVSTLLLLTPGVKTRMFDQIEEKYGENLDVPTDFITPEVYAEQVIEAIEDNQRILLPKGATRMGLFVAQHLPAFFKMEVQRRFKR